MTSKAECTDSPSARLSEAVSSGNFQATQDWLPKCRGIQTTDAKKAAILLGKDDVLELLFFDEDTMTTACEHRNYNAIRILLARGWPINRPIHSTASLLSTAVNDLAFMQWLLQNGADINARSDLDESVLSIAIVQGSLSVVQFLLETGADISHGDLLHCVAQRSDSQEGSGLVDLLVSRGANVNAYRYDNPVAKRWRALFKLPTPLHVACDHNNVQVVKALLRHGADPQRKMLEAGEPAPPSPYEKARTMRYLEIVDLFERN